MANILDMLKSKISIFDNGDPTWVQFVRDHLSIIKQESTKKTLSPEYVRPFNYKLEYLLVDNNLPMAYAWIVCLLNNLSSNEEFVNIPEILIPKSETIGRLYGVYKSTNR